MSTNKELRAKARANLGGGIFQTMWLLTLVVLLIYSVIIGFASYTVVGSILLAGPLEYGVSRILVSTARGKKDVDFGSLFVAFTEDFGNTVVLGLLKNIFIFLWSLLLIIPGIVKSYSYALAAFIQQDAEDKNWKVCIDKSREMMDGNKWKLFCLDLSFIGWYIVGVLCLGVGVLFVEPYHIQARAEFYEDLKNQNAPAAAKETPVEPAAE
ncbi:MAG: DUF975 family protein [Clostridia bacterium]|nr:DUF975 family protein [Clostridia bacterium]